MNKIISPANRVAQIQEYYFARKLKEIAQLNANGADIISLGIGGPDKMPPIETIETLCEEVQKPDAHSYQPFGGIPQLRKAYADWYGKKYGVKLDPNTELQPLIGSKEAVLHIDLTFLNPGDGVLVPNPGYPTYTSAAKLAEANIYYYDLTEENGWQPDFEELEKLPLDKIKLMWLNYPHMPTGAKARIKTFEKAIAFAKKHGIVLVNDNPYSFILNKKPLSIMQVEDAKDVAIELNSLSKSHNMAGWRMGVLVSNSQFVQWVVKVKSNVDSGQFKPAMLAAVKAMEAPASWYQQLNDIYKERRLIAEEIMNALECKFDPEQSGLFLWGRISDNEKDAESLCNRILYDARVFVTPGFIFGSNGNRYIRISLCATPEKMKEALIRIKTMINKNN